jgi:hypothetical protein
MTEADTPRCEICGAPAVAARIHGETKTPLCAVHLSMSDHEAAAFYAKILRIKAGEED